MSPTNIPMSYTAPHVTESEFKLEQLNMTKEEAYCVACDRRGFTPLPWETAKLREQGLADLQKALERIIDKGDYLRALELAPHVAEKESNPLFFLRCEHYNGTAAAVRLTKYWKMRCQIFGDRALLPLTQTGEDALMPEDIANLREGAVQFLAPDEVGRLVVYLRRSQFAEQRRTMVRSLFYLFAVACQDSHLQRHGFVFIVDTGVDYTPANNDRKASKLVVEIVRHVVPMRLWCNHICYPEMKCVAKLILPSVLSMLGPDLRKRACIHDGSPKELLFDLTKFGMHAHALPVWVGGGFTIAQWQEYLDDVHAKEMA